MRPFFFALLLLPLLVGGADALLEGWDSDIILLEKRVARDPEDFIAWNLLVDRYLRRQHWTGDAGDLRRAAHAAAQSLEAAPAELNPGGLAGSARVAIAQHRFADARAAAEKLRDWQPGKSLPWQLLGDALLELGEYDEAARSYDEMLKFEGSTVATEPRLARLDIIHGRNDRARERFATALALAREISPPKHETVAWCHVQIGELAFKNGDWEKAERAYLAALDAQPESWIALEHLAELRGSQADNDEAIALYEKVIGQVPRPEFKQALGDLHAMLGHESEAKRWHESALADYLESVERGEVHYFHHLAGFFADSLNQPAKAVEWARKDLVIRHSIQAHDALAWALYKKGEIAEAVVEIAKALQTGAKDAHLLHHAGMIRMSAGDLPGGKAALQDAVAANPRYNTFHVHR
jgi:tetratricopeptide (TPR) repeat protein